MIQLQYPARYPPRTIAPKTSGKLSVSLPQNWKDFDVLYITATDLYGRQLNTWSWTITTPEEMAKRIRPKDTGTVSVKENDGNLIMNANNVEVTIDQKTGLLLSAKNSKGTLSLKNGPVLISGEATTSTVTHADTSTGHVVKVTYEGKQRFQFTWTMMPSGILKLNYQYRPENHQEMLGVTFDYPEDRVKGIQLIANGPYRVYKNRMKGTTFNSWTKTYNNAVTGEVWDYPEFKGYYSNFYAGKFQTNEGDFSVYTDTENLFLHLLNPAVPKGLGKANSMAVYPKSGGISFMHGITAIGTKSQKKKSWGHKAKTT
ncbi:MAG: hypothetical protein WKG06_38310 [Segetibacter sp.]